MQGLGRVEIFLEVARRQSFAGAAKALGMTSPAISKQVMALEAELGVRLLHRTTRMVSLTDEGALYYERARLAMDELKDAAAAIQDLKTTPAGIVRINAPLTFGHMHLLPVLSGFARKYPDVHLDIALDDRKVDVIADGFDIVIRIGVAEDSTLVSRVLGECPICVVASPAYLAAHGLPVTPSELKDHRVIVYAHQGGAGEWRYKDPQGKTGSFKSEGVFRANTAEMMLQAALDGVGVATLPYFTVGPHLQAGQLVRLFPGYETHPPRQIMALMPPNRYRAAKVRLLVDWIAQGCRAMMLDDKA